MKAHRPEVIILQTLLDAEGGVVSGAVLARELGMSRVAVWQHMEKLREQGFTFEALHAQGYRLIGKPAALNPALIDAYRRAGRSAGEIHVLDEIDSTNDEAVRRLSADEVTPFAIVALRQTKGRGRFGRVWHSERGNLYASFAFRPEVEPARMQTFTLWMGVNICELIAKFCRTTPAIKWPNDILFEGRKAGGMLTEARMDTDCIRDLVFGLGLNLTPPEDGWPDELADRAISISEYTHQPIDTNRFTAALAGRVFSAYERFINHEYTKTFATLWNSYDLLRGRTITLVQGSRTITGVAKGIDDEGSLLLKPVNGPPERFRAGEVTLEKK